MDLAVRVILILGIIAMCIGVYALRRPDVERTDKHFYGAITVIGFLMVLMSLT